MCFNKIIKRLNSGFVLVLLALLSAHAQPFNIVDFGAKSSYTELSTQPIQAAIDACEKAGGGTVIIPKGTFVTGTLFLKSNVTIQMEAYSELFGSTSLNDYADVPLATEEPQFSKCLFYAKDQHNIKIIGHPRSEINGRGYFFKHSPERPRLFRIEDCKNIEFDNAIIKNSGSWCMYFKACEGINIHHTSVYNKENKNNDGMDFDGCSNVSITDSNLQVEDDAICLKSSIDKICENFVISNCTISSYWASVKFGTASKTGFRNIKITDCQFFDSRHGAIKLLAVDGAVLEDVEISNIKMFNCGGPIFVRLGNRGRSYDKSIRQIQNADAAPEGRPVGKIRNLLFRNIEGRLTGRIDPPTECIMMTGLPNHYIENVVMENIHFSYTGFGDLDVKDRVVPEEEARYPEQLFFGVLPAYGMYLRHVKGLVLKDVTLQLRNADDRPAIVMEDVVESRFEQIEMEVHSKAKMAMLLKDCQNITLNQVLPKAKIDNLLEVQGAISKKIMVDNSTSKSINFKKTSPIYPPGK